VYLLLRLRWTLLTCKRGPRFEAQGAGYWGPGTWAPRSGPAGVGWPSIFDSDPFWLGSFRFVLHSAGIVHKFQVSHNVYTMSPSFLLRLAPPRPTPLGCKYADEITQKHYALIIKPRNLNS